MVALVTGNFNVTLSVTESGNFIDTKFNKTPSVSIARNGNTPFSVDLHNDSVEEANNNIQVTIEPDTSGTPVYATGRTVTATMNVTDNDANRTVYIQDRVGLEGEGHALSSNPFIRTNP